MNDQERLNKIERQIEIKEINDKIDKAFGDGTKIGIGMTLLFVFVLWLVYVVYSSGVF